MENSLNSAKKKNQNTDRSFKESGLKWLGLLLGLIIIVGGIIYYNGNDVPAQPILLIDAVSPADHTQGLKTTSVILLEYSDLQCPACRLYHPVIKQLMAEYKDKILFVYRHFPLRSVHKNADLAAQATEAANLQGKFWEMHDLLFENQSTWAESKSARDIFLSYAKQLGLDEAKFLTDLDSRGVKAIVNNHFESALKAGIDSTPTFFLNGQSFKNPPNYEIFKKLIDSALQGNLKK